MRLHALDSLRGLAALSVVFYHALLVFPWTHDILFDRGLPVTETRDWAAALLTLAPPALMWSGREAVLLFFVLSGFVLALPFLEGRPPRWGAFALKRVIRLLPPCMAAVLAVALALPLVPAAPRPELGAWFAASWPEQVSTAELLRQMLLLGGDYALNNVLWTLEYELRVSLAFPLLVAAAALPLAAAAAVAFSALVLLVTEATFLGTSFLGALLAVPHFLLGILLARHLPLVSRLLAGGLAWRILLWLACYALLRARWLVPLPGLLCDLANGLGAALLVALVLTSVRAQAALGWPALRWLGRVSFSLYLVHVPLVTALPHLLPDWPAGAAVALAIPASLLAAAALHAAVERPSMALARRVGAGAPGRAGRLTPPPPADKTGRQGREDKTPWPPPSPGAPRSAR